MGLLKKYFNQTRKPEGFLGNMMLTGMNSGHEKLSVWGRSCFPKEDFKQIIDIGCGGGKNIKNLLTDYKESHVTGLDYSSQSIQKSKNFNKNNVDRCTFINGDISRYPLKNNYYDLATAFETIYFWPDIVESFKNVYSSLRENGYFAIINESTNKDGKDEKWLNIIDGMKIYSKETIKDFLEIAGFKKTQIYTNEKKGWICIIAKKGE